MTRALVYICYNLYASNPRWKSNEGKVFKEDEAHEPVSREGAICELCIQRNLAVMQERS